jgi:hypothetical protein
MGHNNEVEAVASTGLPQAGESVTGNVEYLDHSSQYPSSARRV